MSEKKSGEVNKAIYAGSGIVLGSLLIGILIAQANTATAIRVSVAIIVVGYLVACYIWNSAGREG